MKRTYKEKGMLDVSTDMIIAFDVSNIPMWGCLLNLKYHLLGVDYLQLSLLPALPS